MAIEKDHFVYWNEVEWYRGFNLVSNVETGFFYG